MSLDLDSPPRHLERYAPPWARDRRTICGRPLDDVAMWVTFDEGRAIIAKYGQQRARLLLCQTCVSQQNRIQSPSIWDTNPAQVVNDYTSHHWPNSPAFEQTRAELLAIAKLVAAHEAELLAENRAMAATIARVEALAVAVENRMMATAKPSEIWAALAGNDTGATPPQGPRCVTAEALAGAEGPQTQPCPAEREHREMPLNGATLPADASHLVIGTENLGFEEAEIWPAPEGREGL